MEYIRVTKDNLEKEHICCAISNNKDVHFSRYDITQSYMIFGGIPYYLGYLDKELSLAQNVDKLFFTLAIV